MNDDNLSGSKKIEEVLSKMGCIVYDIVPDPNQNQINNANFQLPQGIPLMYNAPNNQYYHINTFQWYNSNMVANKRLDVDEMKVKLSILSLLGGNEFEINSFNDIKKIYAVNLLKKLDNMNNDMEKIDLITNIV
tara:strand:+ start:917 stop:1318 length:402 start_codon:yes stop_codon:yes gene_type:complete